MTKTYKDLFNLNIKYIEFLLEKSLLSHQYIKNITNSGSVVENEIREIFRNILPKRFHVTHGYIVSAESSEIEPVVSPQVDMIIVDTLVPHSIFVVDKQNGMEICLKDSVLGIFEIKRTLNKESLIGREKCEGAFEHLSKILSSVNFTKSDQQRYLPGGLQMGKGINGGYTTNPIVGIIGLEHSKNLIPKPEQINIEDSDSKILSKLFELSDFKPEIDLIASLDGLLYGLINKTSTGLANYDLLIENVRKLDKEYEYGYLVKTKGWSQASILSRIFGYVLMYLQNSTGKKADLNNYYFNKSLK